MASYVQDVHFSHLIQGRTEQVDLASAALEIARDEYPKLDVAFWRSELDGMGMRVQQKLDERGTPETQIAQINQFLFGEQGYRGNRDEYYDPRNSFLNEVMERKLGIPITLSLVYLTIAKRVGLRLHGVGLPAHFIVKYQERDQEIFIDPFEKGTMLSREECAGRVSRVVGIAVELSPDQLEPAPLDKIMLRLLGNLKAIYLRHEDMPRSLRVQERICALSAADPGEQRDLGVLYLRNDRPGPAIELLDRYLTDYPRADDRETVATLIKAATRLRAAMN